LGEHVIIKAIGNKEFSGKLYDKIRVETMTNFDSIVAEVNVTNKRTEEAHQAFGFKKL
jgi:hypothetical protein